MPANSRFVACFMPLVVLASPGTLWAAEKPAAAKFDPAARAKAVAPFIDEQTIAVVHADPSRIDLRPLFERVAEWVPEARTEIGVASLVAQGAPSTLTKAGVNDAYMVVSLADIPLGPPHGAPFLVFPLREGADEKALATLLAPVKEYEVKQRVDSVFFAGSRAALERYKKRKPDERPELAAAFEAAGDTAVQAILLPPKYARRVIEEIMPELPRIVGGGSSRILTDGVLWAAAGADLGGEMSLRVVVQSKNAEAAVAAKAKWADVCRAVRKEAERECPPEVFDAIVAILSPEVQGDRLVLVLDQKNRGVDKLLTAVEPAVERARDNARWIMSANNLHQIGMAMQVYREDHKTFPTAASYDAAGKPLLSWRVHLLPHLGQQKLYEEFHLDEPWDGEHNRKLIERMPAVYASPAVKAKEKGRTTYLLPVGKETWFSAQGDAASKDLKPPGSAIMAVEVEEQRAVVWTKPEDLPFDPAEPLKGLAVDGEDRFPAVFFDGHVERIETKTDAKKLRAMFTREAK